MYEYIDAGETHRELPCVARADGSPITSGTVNYYLRAKSGVNAGKYWRNSDQTWQVAKTGNAMTHDDDGNWEIDLTVSPFVHGILYREHLEESGNLHVPGTGRSLKCRAAPGKAEGFIVAMNDNNGVQMGEGEYAGLVGAVVADNSKAGYSLAPTGLDAITATEPTAKPTTFPGWLMWLVQRFRRADKTPSAITVKTEAGATVTTQAISDDGAGRESLGAPS
jgi:hypothetical protein